MRDSDSRTVAHLIRESPLPALLHAEDGEILAVSRSWERLTGYEAAELPDVGTWTALAYGDRSREVRAGVRRLFELDGPVSEGEFTVRTRDGGTRIWRFHTTPLEPLRDGRRVVLSMAEDLTRLKRTEADLERRTRLYAALSRTNRALPRIPDEPELFGEVCAAAVDEGGFALAWVGSPGPDGLLTVEAARGRVGYLDDVLVSVDAERPEGRGPGGRAFRSGGGVVVNDLAAGAGTQPWREAAARWGLASCAAFPVRVDDEVAAVLTVYAEEVGYFGEPERSLLQEMVDDVGFSLANLERARSLAAARRELEVSEARFRRLAENAPDMIFRYELHPEPGFSYVSPAVERISGYTAEDHYRRPELLEKLVHPEDRARLAAVIQDPPAPGTPVEIRWVREDGSVLWTEQHLARVRDDSGRVVAVEGIARDITHRRRMETELRASERRLRSLVENLAGAVYRFRPDPRVPWGGTLEYMSERIDEVTGLPASDFLLRPGRALLSVVHPGDRERVRRELTDAVAAGRPFEVEHRVVHRDGRVAWVVNRGRATTDDDGGVHVDGVIHDVTLRHRELERIRGLLELSQRGRELDDDELVEMGMELVRSQTFSRTAGLVRVEAGPDGVRVVPVGGTDAELLDWVGSPRGRRLLEAGVREGRALKVGGSGDEPAGAGGREAVVPVPVPGPEGAAECLVLLIGAPAAYTESELGFAGLVGETITRTIRRRATEQELEVLSAAVVQSPVSVVITDPRGDITYVNPKFCEVTGYAPEEVLGRNPRILKSGETPAREYARLWTTITAGEVWAGEFHNKRKDGSLFWERATISPIRESGGDIAAFVAVKEDVTVRRELQHQLMEAQKMEAVGRLAGGIAHDFNNMLTAILSFTRFALESAEPSEELYHDLTEIRLAAERSVLLTGQLLAFGRRQVLHPAELDLNAMIQGLVGMVRRMIEESVTIELDLNPDLPPVWADRSQMEQVVMNLVLNARDAMPGGGRLTIATRLEAGSDASSVLLSVRDTGIGMDEVTMARIFEPFFTTKEMGKGTGLGLSTTYGIIQQSGGSIEVESRPGEGSVFHLRLPATRGAGTARPPTAHGSGEKRAEAEAGADEVPSDAGAVAAADPAASTPEPSARILIVEDEGAVRSVCERILTRAGYRILAADGPDSAIGLMQSGIVPPDLVLTDVVMPGTTGPELVRRLRGTATDVRVVYMSGYAGGEVAGLPQEAHFLEKPFTPEELLGAVRAALTGGGG